MLYDIGWNIEFKNGSQRTLLAFVAELEIIRDIDMLSSTAQLVLPESIMNDPLHFEHVIKRGTEVLIDLGYNGDLNREFTGFVREVRIKDGSIRIECEDALFLFRQSIPDTELNQITLNKICEYVIENIDSSYRLESTYDISYDKFSIYNATGQEVLKKLQEETKANIQFDGKNKILKVSPPYAIKEGEAFYVIQKNVETSDLEYRQNQDKKLSVKVETTDTNGNVLVSEAGEVGGDESTLKVGTMPSSSLQRVAEEWYKTQRNPGYEGSFRTWLIPHVEPGYSAYIKDEDYPDKAGFYFVKAVTTNISSSGAVRTIKPGLKLNLN